MENECDLHPGNFYMKGWGNICKECFNDSASLFESFAAESGLTSDLKVMRNVTPKKEIGNDRD